MSRFLFERIPSDLASRGLSQLKVIANFHHGNAVSELNHKIDECNMVIIALAMVPEIPRPKGTFNYGRSLLALNGYVQHGR